MHLNKKNYRAWLIDEDTFPYSADLTHQTRFIAGYGALAPSQHNTQPWVLKVSDEGLTIEPDLSKSLAYADPDLRGLYISIGMCAENIMQAANYFGMKPKLMINNKFIKILLSPGSRPRAVGGLTAITSRHSNKEIYAKGDISKKTLRTLKKTQSDNSMLTVISEPKDMDEVIKIHLVAAQYTAEDKKFVKELAGWLKSNRTRSYEGMPGFTVGNSNIQSLIGKTLFYHKPELFKRVANKDRALMESSSLIAVWSVRTTSPKACVLAGMDAERFWLKAVECGLVAHPLTAIMSQEKLNQNLKKVLGLQTIPVFLMRLGFSKDKKLRTPRRSP